MNGTQTKAVIKYAVMPGIVPRLRALFASGFGLIAFMMARIYFMVRLLPPDHPYLNPVNIRKYGIRHVIAAAANHLVFKRQNIDQIVVFILILTGVVLLLLQLGVLVASLLFGSAMAGVTMPAGPSMFVTLNPDFDIAFMLLDQVFGVGNGADNFFNSCVSSAVLCPNEVTNPPFPWPFHLALQQMFRFYSTGILLIGAFIVLYFVVVVVIESATTGNPFGQRFKNLWVPVRIVVAIGLLIPLSYGYNSGQYIVFAAAKYGSSFATYAWLRYNNTMTAEMGAGANPTGERMTLVAMPRPPDASILAQTMSIIHTCAFAYYFEDPTIYKRASGSPASAATNPSTLPDPAGQIAQYQTRNKIKPYLVKSVQTWMTNTQERLPLGAGTTYQTALDFYQRGDIVIRFGRFDNTGKLYQEETGKVEPTCGDVRVAVGDPRDPAGASGYLGAVEVQKFMFELIRNLWFDVGQNEDYIDFAGRSYLKASNTNYQHITPCDMGCIAPNPNLPSCTGTGLNRDCVKDNVTSKWKQNATNNLKTLIDAELVRIWQEYNTRGLEIEMSAGILERGWGGAGMWFNTIAQVNGAFSSSIFEYPTLDKYPMIMEKVRSLKKKNDEDIDGVNQFQPNVSVDNTMGIEVTDPNAKAIALGLYKVHEYWNKDAANSSDTEKVVTTGALETAMNAVFGTNGLFSMKENTHIHPLAQLVALGKGLVDSSIRNVAGATFGAAMGGMIGGLSMQAGSFVNAASGFMVSTAFLGLTAGVVLFYILPFLPFVYFYFAVASWLKTIFEAMVGVPLWALAHLRIDGDGLPGDAAANGYFLVLEIFLRPVLSIVGLLAALIIFSAQVRVLHFIWMLVTENLGGYNGDPTIGLGGNFNLKRSIVDEFFFTVLYAVIVYMMATASFKLIDRIPDEILRWMSQGVSSFSDINQDPIQLQRYAAMGGITAGQTAVGGIRDAAAGLGGAVGKAVGGGGKVVP
ncbi:MAG: DotA/TraY family protein [Alphaproteobacteria bacterium]|nr:DotA/TraY family protein [Alphaproteobacteria bacterium]